MERSGVVALRLYETGEASGTEIYQRLKGLGWPTLPCPLEHYGKCLVGFLSGLNTVKVVSPESGKNHTMGAMIVSLIVGSYWSFLIQ